jgi:DNA-binding transcriptional MerR regulator
MAAKKSIQLSLFDFDNNPSQEQTTAASNKPKPNINAKQITEPTITENEVKINEQVTAPTTKVKLVLPTNINNHIISINANKIIETPNQLEAEAKAIEDESPIIETPITEANKPTEIIEAAHTKSLEVNVIAVNKTESDAALIEPEPATPFSPKINYIAPKPPINIEISNKVDEAITIPTTNIAKEIDNVIATENIGEKINLYPEQNEIITNEVDQLKNNSQTEEVEPKIETNPLLNNTNTIAKASPKAIPQSVTTKPKQNNRGRKSQTQMADAIKYINLPDNATLFAKQYYTIGQVAKMFNANVSKIRFWEEQLSSLLKVRKNRKGDRFFTPQNITTLYDVYNLTSKQGLTMSGAAQFLQAQKPNSQVQHNFVEDLKSLKVFLLSLEAGLLDNNG